jgi:cell division protein FtsQ
VPGGEPGLVTTERRPAASRAAASTAPRARTAPLPAIRAPRAVRLVPTRFLPSGRSLLIGVAIAVAACGAYVAARETSTFAVARIEIAGGTPEVRRQVRRTLAQLVGSSLLALDGRSLERRVEALPTVVSVGYDRAFPHTLRLTLVPETPVAVLHRGTGTWLISARGRIVAPVRPRTYPALPRIWVPHATDVAVGDYVDPEHAGNAARAVALALWARFPARIETAAVTHGGLVFHLRSGVELRLGDPTDVRLKLAVARRALRGLSAETAYLDVSVPERPVAGTQPSTLR